MKKRLKDITNIQTGLFAKPTGKGEVVYLQSRHFDEDGQLLSTLHADLKAEGISAKHLLKNGDVLFAAKGTKNFATVFENHIEPAVASTSFFVLRPMNKTVLPQYLAWFLNSPTSQSLLKSQAIGTSIPSITKQVLENIEMTVPGIEIQKAILQIMKLRNKEKALRLEIDTLRDMLIQQQIINAII